MFYNQDEQSERRELWFSKVREHIYEWVNPDGSGLIPQFDPPWREVLWILPALYTGSQTYIDLANCMLGRYNNGPKVSYKDIGEQHGKQFGIFQSNTIAVLLNCFGDLMTEQAREVAQWHTNCVFRTFDGSAQPDYKFHGANDNMPMMATCGLILGGEALSNEYAVKHGFWNLHQVRRHLSRCAWMSEFNSSTYSPITLTGAAKIATYSKSPEIRELALEIEHRLWAELLLHYHPGTKMQAGPHCRAYAIDNVGHSHTLQALFWLAFGTEKSGRDILKSYYSPDGIELLHFCGNPAQSIAEFTDAFDCELHVPKELASLITQRQYPAILKGRSEIISYYKGAGGMLHTETYMEEDFSLGTVNLPLCSGEQTNQLYATYKQKENIETFRNSNTVFYKYLTKDLKIGEYESSVDGKFSGELFQKNMAWVYAFQHKNTALMTCSPNVKDISEEVDTLKLDIIFPAHYGNITRNIMGEGEVSQGAMGESAEVVPVSIETGEVFIHIQPLLPTNLPRKAAIRFNNQNKYEVLELINYESEMRKFTKTDLAQILNGMVFTIDSHSKYESFEQFHQLMSKSLVLDMFYCDHRYLNFQRDDVDFELTITSEQFGVQTESINGRSSERPIFVSNQLDVDKLPFMSGKVKRNFPFFPWEKLECISFQKPWYIGSRALSSADNYKNRRGI